MNPISMQRFRELYKIEEERADLMHGMVLLMNARHHLKKGDPSDARENLLASEQMSSLIGPMEDRNKHLTETGAALWHAILELDGLELTSPEIEEEIEDVRLGSEWLARIQRRIVESHPADNPPMKLLMELAELSTQLGWREGDLRRRQDEYRWAMAETLSHGSSGYEN